MAATRRASDWIERTKRACTRRRPCGGVARPTAVDLPATLHWGVRTLTLACVMAASIFGAAARSRAPLEHADVDWQARAREDLVGYATAARDTYIYAAYPDPARWRRHFDATLRTVETKLPLVHDAAGYQAILKYLSVTFQDAHVGIQFTQKLPGANWPGFLARFDNGSYRITASQNAGVEDGAAITACDKKPVKQWIATISRFEVGLPLTLETTRNIAALHLFVDRSSPLRARPTSCTIGGREVTLDWMRISSEELGAALDKAQGEPAEEASTRLIGLDGAWVRLGYFEPTNAKQAADFHAAMDTASSLRDKRFIVLDVRGNGGGPYNWFMGYLRALYSQAYADYYATARLHIRAVHL